MAIIISTFKPFLFLFLVTCPDGFTAILGKCYKFSTDGKTWNEAQIACQGIESGSYDLAVIDNEALNEKLKEAVEACKASGKYCGRWIGLNDIFSEGNVQWVNGEPLAVEIGFSQSPWDKGQPDVSILSFYLHNSHVFKFNN